MPAENSFKCSGDCLRCHPNQRAYCSAQFTYNSMRMLEAMQGTLTTLQGAVSDIQGKIEAIQNSEADIFDPTQEENSEIPTLPTAQSGDGAESRSPANN